MKVGSRRLGRGVAAVGAAAVLLTGCEDAGSDRAATGGAPARDAAVAAPSTGELEKALLTEFRSAEPMVGPQSGPLSSMAAMAAGATQPGIETDEPECVTVMQAFDPGKLGNPSSALVALSRMPDFMVSEMLVAATEEAATPLLGQGVPEKCRDYSYTLGGDPSRVTISELSVPTLGRASRAFAVRTAFTKIGVDGTQYVLVFRADGYAGSLSMVGSRTDEQSFIEYARQAYDKASRTLG